MSNNDDVITVPLEQLIDAHTVIPSLRGIKYTSLDLSQFSKCLTHCGGKMQMFYGCDEVRLPCDQFYIISKKNSII